ncbi:hypothetical protein BB560_004910 [Smittium megazygosporum]|uniref:Uncharacterized protein n=1 Tax=Smittium megazygosporum TaxID=133381 RepID=A0A2T9Z829_9FUNG|nr:hypothetical protein BB560_004910 [Smittium megazygosporum]
MFSPLEYLFWLLLVSNSVLCSVAPKFELENKDVDLSRRQSNILNDTRFTLDCPVTETVAMEKSLTRYGFYLGSYFMSSNVYSSNPFTLNGCSSGYFYMTFNINYTAVKPSFFSVVLANGTKGITSDPAIDYKFYPYNVAYIFYKSGGASNNSPVPPFSRNLTKIPEADKYFILHDQAGSKVGINSTIYSYLNAPSALNKIIFNKGTKAFLVDDSKAPANIHNITVKCLANDTCVTASQAPSSSPGSGDGNGTPSDVDTLRNAASNTTVSNTATTTATITVTTTATTTATTRDTVTTTATITATTTATAATANRDTVTTTVSATCADNQLPTNIVVTDSLTVKSLKSNKNYSENEKINIPCSGDFTLSLTSNSRDSDLFFGFSDANGISKDAKFVELQIGLKNGQNAIKDLVTAKVKRRNLVKRQGSAKINLVYVNGIYSLLSNGQSFTTFTSSNIIPKSLTITPFDGTVTLSNFVLTCM